MTFELKPSRWVVEGAVIVVSILLAFAIDAWWDDRAEMAVEVRAIDQFVTELDLLEQLLDDADRRTEAAIGAAETMLAAIHGDQVLSEDDLGAALRDLDDQFFLADAMIAFHHLVGAGAMGAISSDGTRDVVANISDYLGVLLRFENLETDFIEDRLRPYLQDAVDLYALGRAQGFYAEGLAGQEAPPESRFQVPTTAILGDLRFSNLLADRIRYARAVRHFRSALSDELARVRSSMAIEG